MDGRAVVHGRARNGGVGSTRSAADGLDEPCALWPWVAAGGLPKKEAILGWRLWPSAGGCGGAAGLLAAAAGGDVAASSEAGPAPGTTAGAGTAASCERGCGGLLVAVGRAQGFGSLGDGRESCRSLERRPFFIGEHVELILVVVDRIALLLQGSCDR